MSDGTSGRLAEIFHAVSASRSATAPEAYQRLSPPAPSEAESIGRANRRSLQTRLAGPSPMTSPPSPPSAIAGSPFEDISLTFARTFPTAQFPTLSPRHAPPNSTSTRPGREEATPSNRISMHPRIWKHLEGSRREQRRDPIPWSWSPEDGRLGGIRHAERNPPIL